MEDYKKFVGISAFSDFTIKSKEMTLEKSTTQGFDAPAAVFYDVPTGKHSLEIWSKLYLPQMNVQYLVFHEFTHICNAEVYFLKDKVKHMSNKGCTEIHTAQDVIQGKTLKKGLYSFFFKHKGDGQIIIVDNLNVMPDMNLEALGAKVTTYHKDEKNGPIY